MRVLALTSEPARFQSLESVFITPSDEVNPPQAPPCYVIERARTHQQKEVILKVAEVNDRDAAESLRDHYLLISLADALPLGEDEYYQFQLLGLEMRTLAGQILGRVSDILETGANFVYVVESPTYGELLIPAIASVIESIDLEAGQIRITPIAGLLPNDPPLEVD
jgi:16S rRNA processing protein RimM